MSFPMHFRPVPSARAHARALLALSLLPWSPLAWSQAAAPGMQLQQPVPPRPTPTDAGALPALPAPATAAPAAAGGSVVTLRAVTIQDNTLVDTASLLAAIGPLAERRFDFAGLQALANTVTAAYRQRGYPFTQTVLPPQNLASGELVLRVIEGVYGRLILNGKDPLIGGAQAFLDAELRPGDPIRNQPLERAMLLLNDQPGFRVQPVLRPGEYRGEGNLVVAVQRKNDWSADLGLDNGGSRATGEWRARAAVSANSPWRFGDRVTLTTLVTDKRMWLGSAEYDAPLGGAGTRGAVSVARTSYQLDGAFSALGATGRADVVGLRLSHALVRSQTSNVTAALSLQHKSLHDDLGQGTLVRDKSSSLGVASLQFDHRDRLGGGGVSFGSLSLTWGRLGLDEASALADSVTAQTAGGFSKWSADVARIQRLADPFSAYLRLSAQGSGGGNLDASEKMGLGGLLGVRAYPLGEGTGDAGWLGQMELRWDAGWATPFVFYDAGRMRSNARPWAADAESVRQLAGAGVGVRWASGPWSAEGLVASRLQGGPPTSDAADRRPRAYIVVGRRID